MRIVTVCGHEFMRVCRPRRQVANGPRILSRRGGPSHNARLQQCHLPTRCRNVASPGELVAKSLEPGFY